jgi:hypothetical protein
MKHADGIWMRPGSALCDVTVGSGIMDASASASNVHEADESTACPSKVGGGGAWDAAMSTKAADSTARPEGGGVAVRGHGICYGESEGAGGVEAATVNGGAAAGPPGGGTAIVQVDGGRLERGVGAEACNPLGRSGRGGNEPSITGACTFACMAGVSGKVLCVNKRLLMEPHLLWTRPHDVGYLAVLAMHKREHSKALAELVGVEGIVEARGVPEEMMRSSGVFGAEEYACVGKCMRAREL